MFVFSKKWIFKEIYQHIHVVMEIGNEKNTLINWPYTLFTGYAALYKLSVPAGDNHLVDIFNAVIVKLPFITCTDNNGFSR